MNQAVHIALYTLFGIFILCTVAGALIAVFSSRVLRGVSGLAICSVGLSGIFYFLGSPFIALMEVLIYIGAVCITIIFAIMLAEPEETTAAERREAHGRGSGGWTAAALAASLGLFAALAWLGWQHPWRVTGERLTEGSVQDIGRAFLTTYSLAFELISLLLLAAILGALAIARAGRRISP